MTLRKNLRICICGAQVPFVQGGAEKLINSLKEQLEKSGHLVDIVQLPFKWYPNKEVLNNCLAWRLLDLSESSGEPIDLVIGTKFPSYLIRHPKKIIWLVHQFRQIYDYYDSSYSAFQNNLLDNELREQIIQLDTQALKEAKQIYTISDNVRKRCQKFNGIEAHVLYPPLDNTEEYYSGDYDDYILSVSRLEEDKRIDLLLKALAKTPNKVKAFIVGTGTQKNKLTALRDKLGLTDRATFVDYISREELLKLYANCFAVFFCPVDEDYGYVTLEAFQSKKPIITAQDSGGVLEFVRESRSGFICHASPKALADKIELLHKDKKLCRTFGEAGYKSIQYITWANILNQLLSVAEEI
jgi:glycosyltransferase involved in cell wall biosynthesis